MKDWPIYFKDRLIVGNPKSDTAVVTLWTPVAKLAEGLDPDSFSVAGQLYSKDGINYIIRNALANPRIKKLIICGEDRVGSGDALMKFIENGIDQDNMIVGADMAQIHQEIATEGIQTFRKNVTFENHIGKFTTDEIQPLLKDSNQNADEWAEPAIYPDKKIEFDGVMPTDQSVFKIRRKYAGEVWLEIIKKILKFGTIRESFHGNNCKELFNIAAVITDEDPENFKMFPYFNISEEDIKNYIPKMMTGEKGTADYTYGERLWNYPEIPGQEAKYNQVEEVIIDFLSRYPTDRAACAPIFDVRDHTAKSAPCMTFVQATNVDNKLDLTVYFRSHDIFGGWLLNVFGLRTVQKHIAHKLKMPLGNLTIYSNCAHIYDNNWEAAQEMIKKYGNSLDCTSDPRGYLIITVEGEEIIAKHLSPNGKPIQEFKQNGKEEGATIKLYNQMVLADVVSLIPHAFDLGAEIQKAEIAVKVGLDYVQDQPLKFQN